MDRGKRRRTAKLDPIQVGAKIKHQDKPYRRAPGCCSVAKPAASPAPPLCSIVGVNQKPAAAVTTEPRSTE
jgi:hypothetical protein